MIGWVSMDIGEAEMMAAMAYYLNSDLFFSKHKVYVTKVKQRSNGRFVIEFKGSPEVRPVPKAESHPAMEGATDDSINRSVVRQN